MEELTTEKLEEMLLKNKTSEEAYQNYIVNNKNIPEDLKNEWNMFMSNDYLFQDLSRDDICQIMKLFHMTSLKTMQIIGNDPEAELIIHALRMELRLNLNRAFDPYKSNGDFFSILNLSLKER